VPARVPGREIVRPITTVIPSKARGGEEDCRTAGGGGGGSKELKGVHKGDGPSAKGEVGELHSQVF